MRSAEHAEPGVAPEPDELKEREAAAARAFAALHVDGGADAGSPGPGEPDQQGALQPDAVLQGLPFTRDDRRRAARVEVEVAPPRSGAEAAGAQPETTTTPGAPGAPAEPATGDGEPAGAVLDAGRYLLDLFALAVATGALVTPWAWLGLVAAAVAVTAAGRRIALHGASPGRLARGAGRELLARLRPRSLTWAAGVTVRIVLAAVLLPASVAAGSWALEEGTRGVAAAARMAVWAHGFRVAAATTCFLLVSGLGEDHERRAAALRAAAARLRRGATVALASGVTVVAALVLTTGPRLGAGPLAGDDGLGWLPAPLRDEVDRLRDGVASTEVHAAAGCLTDRQDLSWHGGYTAGNPPGAADTAVLAVQGDGVGPADLVSAVAALHNQLAPWIEHIEVRAAGTSIATVDRSLLPTGRPVVEPAPVVEASTRGRSRLAEGAAAFDRDTALACGVAPIP